MKTPRRVYKKVSKITDGEWKAIKDRANLVIENSESLEESIRKRERIASWWDKKGDLVGLMTVDIRHEKFKGTKTVCVYAGNTWFHPDYRGKNLGPKFGVIIFGEALVRWPFAKHFWFFGSNNYKSYLAMARNLKEMWPKYDTKASAWERDYIQHLGEVFYNEKVDPTTFVLSKDGISSFRKEDTDIPDKLKDDPNVQFYLENNPGYVNGNRMMCLGSLSLSNLSYLYVRAVKRALGSL